MKFPKITSSSKSIAQIALAVLMLVMSIYFVKNEHLELVEIKQTLRNLNPVYLALGLFITCIYLLFQAFMCVLSFKTVGVKVHVKDALMLFLKRNLVSIFLPAGGILSLAFFNKPLSKKGINTTDI